MTKGDYLQSILRSKKTVFTIKDVSLLWQDVDTNAAKSRLNYYVRTGNLYRIRRGIYAKSKSYEKLDLATRICTPSYVSFETILLKEGIIFQYQTTITLASYCSRTIEVDNQKYSYQKIKEDVLLNPLGILHEKETSIASKERALLDTLYIHADYHFDNTRLLDWNVVFTMLPMYDNKRMQKKVHSLYDH